MSSGRLILPLAEPALLATGEPDTGAVETNPPSISGLSPAEARSLLI